MTTPAYWHDACAHLSAKDPVMARLIAAYQGENLKRRGKVKNGPFYTLCRAIVGQQISVKAADSVWRKCVAQLKHITPQQVLDTSEAKLRACGLSGQKVRYMQCLAEAALGGHFAPHHMQQEDEALIKHLTQIKGIGRWTAEMFLMFYLLRPNVLPLQDIGLLKAMEKHYGSRTPKQMKHWAPYNTVATWYLWRSLDPLPVEY